MHSRVAKKFFISLVRKSREDKKRELTEWSLGMFHGPKYIYLRLLISTRNLAQWDGSLAQEMRPSDLLVFRLLKILR